MTDYQKYQLQWMIDHDHSLDELISELVKCEKDRQPEDNIQNLYESWVHDCGFGSEIWACEEEWEDAEKDFIDDEEDLKRAAIERLEKYKDNGATIKIHFDEDAIEWMQEKFFIDDEEDLKNAAIECIKTYMEM